MQETEYYNEIKDLIINNEVNKKVILLIELI